MENSNTSTIEFVTGLGDDSLILGQRIAEWCSNAPFLEEDLALTNVALDFLGRAQMFYNYAAELHNSDTSVEPITADDIAYLRDAREYKNTLIHELPIGDFAYTMARQFLIDCFGVEYMSELCNSSDETIAGIAAKAIKECRYHMRRSHDWVLRLGDGTEESHKRVQSAFDQLWGYTAELFEMTESESDLLSNKISVDKTKLKEPWMNRVKEVLAEATIELPTDEWTISGGRDGIHTEHLGQILSELQYLQRAYPGLNW